MGGDELISRVTPVFLAQIGLVDELAAMQHEEDRDKSKFGEAVDEEREIILPMEWFCVYPFLPLTSMIPWNGTTSSLAHGRPLKMVPGNTTLSPQGKRGVPCQRIPGHFRGGEVCLNKTQFSWVATICLFLRSPAPTDTWVSWTWGRWSSLQMVEKG